MKFILLVAHGSRNSNANEEIKQLALRVEEFAALQDTAVVCAFLEFEQPDIVAGIDLCAGRGARHITVVPYFLAAGNHVVRDIPAQLEQARQNYPDIDIEQSPHVGSVEAMAQAILSCVK